MWAPPIYSYQKYSDSSNSEMWIGRVELPHVGVPLLSVPKHIGPLVTRPCPTVQQAQVEAAESALQVIKVIFFNVLFFNTGRWETYSEMLTRY